MDTIRVALAVLAAAMLVPSAGQTAEEKLVNASYDVSREFYKNFNEAFAAEWKTKTSP